eukprot:TRINITY_DN2584_c0_g3_i1.p2 TRINITY_DN2584_c0_g3~~TRINITY_DN2584_c0_g3_i1.p2  ORF type:complete len:151 (+),score=58.30 TRINITY_DN2584_c0_g3_i1:63-515(+)
MCIRDRSYKAISSSLHIPENEIEELIQQAVDNEIMEAKMDQLEETAFICPKTKRIIAQDDWKAIKNGLLNAKEKVSKILVSMPAQSVVEVKKVEEKKVEEKKVEEKKVESKPAQPVVEVKKVEEKKEVIAVPEVKKTIQHTNTMPIQSHI